MNGLGGGAQTDFVPGARETLGTPLPGLTTKCRYRRILLYLKVTASCRLIFNVCFIYQCAYTSS